MLHTTETLLKANFASQVIQDIDVANLFGGTAARQYGLIYKAIKANELIRLRRGLYVIAPEYSKASINEYYLANQLVPYSFVTAEAALSFHGWIPEKITNFISMSPFGRNKKFTTRFGLFIYRVVNSIAKKEFLTGVRRVEMDQQTILIATPLRALLDYVYWSKVRNVNLDFLQKSLRIENEMLLTITVNQCTELKNIYPQQRMKNFLKRLAREITNVTSDH